MKPEDVNRLLESSKELLLRQARFDLAECFVLFFLFTGATYGAYKLALKCRESDDDMISELGALLIAAGGCITAILSLAALDGFFNLLYNPLFYELKELLKK